MRRIPYADYRVNEVIPVLSEKDFTDSSQMGRQENRLFRKRYGIKIEFHQTGRLGVWGMIHIYIFFSDVWWVSLLSHEEG